MALKQNHTTPQGITIQDAYIRVIGVDVGAKLNADAGGGNAALVKIGIHVSPDKPMLEYRTASFLFDVNGDNVFVQAYTYLKTLPEFSDAVDC